MNDDLKNELRGTLRSAIGGAVAAGAASFVAWVRTRPLKRAIERRRARPAPPPVASCPDTDAAKTTGRKPDATR